MSIAALTASVVGPPIISKGVVARAPLTSFDSLTVIVPSFSPSQEFVVAPERWMIHSVLPVAGEPCLVLFDEDGLAYAVLWGVEAEVALGADSDPSLTWHPPTLVTPTVISNFTGSYLQLNNTLDYVFDLKAIGTKTTQFMVEGGRNIIVIGGAVTNFAGGGAAVFYFTDNGTGGAAVDRTIHVEGVDIDMTVNDDRDAFGLQTPTAIVQLQNIRVRGVQGTAAGTHGDIIQNYSALRGLRLDRFTGDSDYQGLFLSPGAGGGVIAEGLKMRRTDLTLKVSATETFSHLLWLMGVSPAYQAADLEDVWFLNERPGQDAQDAAFPDASQFGVASTFIDGKVRFPKLYNVHGVINDGTPPGGHFVTDDDCGLNYQPPGYKTS